MQTASPERVAGNLHGPLLGILKGLRRASFSLTGLADLRLRENNTKLRERRDKMCA